MEELFKYFNIISKHTNVYLDQALTEFGLCSCHRPFVKIIVNKQILRIFIFYPLTAPPVTPST